MNFTLKKNTLQFMIIFVILESVGLVFSKVYPRQYFPLSWEEASDIEDNGRYSISLFYKTSFRYLEPTIYSPETASTYKEVKNYKYLPENSTWHFKKLSSDSVSLSFDTEDETFYLAVDGNKNTICTSNNSFRWWYSCSSSKFSFSNGNGGFLSCNETAGIALSGSPSFFLIYSFSENVLN